MTFAISSPSFSNAEKILLCGFIVLLTLGLPGCGGSSSQTSPATQAPAITSASSTAFTEGVAGSFTVTATGSPTPSIAESGTLPSGVTFNAGALSGTPTASGTFNVTFTASNGISPNAVQNFTLTVNASAVLTVTTTSLPAGAVGTAYNQTLTATGGVAPYKWSLTGGSLPAGLSLSSTGVISGSPSAASTSNFTVTVADSESPAATATANLSIVVSGPATLTITTTTLPNGAVGTAYSTTVNAAGGVQPYTWSTSGGLPSGLSLSSSGTISGTPTTAGSSIFTVSVSDSENPVVTVSAVLSITINIQAACTNNANFSGNYAFMMRGWIGVPGGPGGSLDFTLFWGSVGSFYSDGNGNITQGTMYEAEPYSGSGGSYSGQWVFTGTYCLASNNLGTATITYNYGTQLVTGTLAFSLQSDGNGSIIFYDTNSTAFQGSGVLRKQDVTAFLTSKITGSYAFGLVGVLGIPLDVLQARQTMAGVIDLDGNGNITGGTFDANGGVTESSSTVSGDYSVGSGTSGCGTMNTNQGFSFVFCVVNTAEILMLSYVADPSVPVIVGPGLLQTGPFTNASLSGVSVIGTETFDGTTSEVRAGLITTDGAGSFTVSMDDNDGGVESAYTLTGTYNIEQNGRTTVGATTCSNGPCPPYSPIFYLVNQNEAFVVGTSQELDFGKMVPQSGSNFTNASLNGNFMGGSEQPVGTGWSNAGEEVDSVNFNGIGTITGTSNQNSPGSNGVYSPSQVAVTDTYAVSPNGRVVVSCVANPNNNCTDGQQEAIIYIISPTQFVDLPTTSNTHPYLIDFKQ